MPNAKSGASLSETSYERVRDRLRADILSGSLAPGSRLKIADLSKQYGLSLMPVREALQQLQGEGLIVAIPKRGAIVRVPDFDLVSQIFDIRIALEGALARGAAAVATQADLEKLREALEHHEREKGDREAHIHNNLDFHKVISTISGNEEAAKILDQHNQILLGLRRRVGYGPRRIDEVVEDHKEIYRAIAAGDELAARRAAENHTRRAKEDMLHCMKTVI